MSTELVHECGIAKSTFLRLLVEHDVDPRPRGLTPDQGVRFSTPEAGIDHPRHRQAGRLQL